MHNQMAQCLVFLIPLPIGLNGFLHFFKKQHKKILKFLKPECCLFVFSRLFLFCRKGAPLVCIVFITKRAHAPKPLLRLLKHVERHTEGYSPVPLGPVLVQALTVGEPEVVSGWFALGVDLFVYPALCLENIGLLRLRAGALHHEHALDSRPTGSSKGKLNK